MPVILPWTFLMFKGGVRNFQTKLNMAAYLGLFFLGVFFPIYYFFELLEEREKKLIEERNVTQKEYDKNNPTLVYKQDMWLAHDPADKRPLPKERYKITEIQFKTGKGPKVREVTFTRLVTFEIIEQWYLCQANFLYPCLALLY